MRFIYVFDLDGTLASMKHRLHLIQPIDGSEKDYSAFYEACSEDTPNFPVIWLLRSLAKDFEVVIVTGRSEQVREKTVKWLYQFTGMTFSRKKLFMRRIGDFRHDVDIKREWLRNLTVTDRGRLAGVFEDRARVVQMWREEGVPAFQVDNGNF